MGTNQVVFSRSRIGEKVPVPGQQPACKGAAEEEALYMDFLEQEYSFLVASGAERNMGRASLVNSGF